MILLRCALFAIVARLTASYVVCQDLEMNENGLDCLSSENQEIVQNGDRLKEEFKKHPCHLERLHGGQLLYVRLFINTNSD